MPGPRRASALARAGAGGEGVVVVVGRPSLAEAARSWPRPPPPWPPRGPGRASSRRCAGATSWARSTWASPRGCSRAGSASTRAGPGSRRRGGRCPPRRGRDATGHAAGAGGRAMGAVVLARGRTRSATSPTVALAEEALERAGFVVAVDGFASPSAALADVVLPVAVAARARGDDDQHRGSGHPARPEARGARAVLAGLDDRRRARRPARRRPRRLERGRALGRDRAAGAAHAGITRLVLDAPAARDGVVGPAAGRRRCRSRRAGVLAPIDPMATPGIDAVETQGAPPRAGPAEPPGGDELARRRQRRDVQRRRAGPAPVRALAGARRSSRPCPPPTLLAAARVAAVASTTTACCSRRAGPSPPLAAAATVRANPYDLGRLGVTDARRGCGCAPRAAPSSSRPSPTTACRAAWWASTSTSTATATADRRRATPAPRR